MKCPLTALKQDCSSLCKWHGELEVKNEDDSSEVIPVCAIERLADSFNNLDTLAGMMMSTMFVQPDDKEGLVQ